MKQLESQRVRALAPEMDALRMGMGWTVADLSKPQILVESSFGDSHPGSAHLLDLANVASAAIQASGGRAARYFATDICDGMAQGHDGMNYSLPSRDVMADLIEIHGRATGFDAAVFIAGCDKSLPAHLIAAGRLNIPCVVVPGGVMSAGPDMLTLEQLGAYHAQFKRGEIAAEQWRFYERHACPTCGACAFMGTAGTMQVLSEALGLTLPYAALTPFGDDLTKLARESGELAVKLALSSIRPRDIVKKANFENAIIVHAAISGSTNALLHIPAAAKAFGVDITPADFDRLHKGAKYVLDVRPTGKFPSSFVCDAGGVPAIMNEVRASLRLEAMTITGETLGERLDRLKPSVKNREVIHEISNNGAIAVLFGNLAPDGAVVKHSAVPKEMFRATLRTRVFDREEDALNAVLSGEIKPGDAVVIRYEGLRGSGMPEMFYTTAAISADAELARQVALITDGRFSGASIGPAIGHVSPEAALGGPIARLRDGDVIELDIERRRLNVVGWKS